MGKLKDQLAGVAALIGVLGAIGAGVYKISGNARTIKFSCRSRFKTT